MLYNLNGQSILGGAGICHVSSDPNGITALRVQDTRGECFIAFDTISQTVYVYDQALTEGTRWIPLRSYVSLGNKSDINVTDTATWTINNNVVTNAKIRQSNAYSVIGNSTASTANVADISASVDNQVLRRSGTTLGFGALNLASTDAVTNTLGVTNGGTGRSTANTTGSVVFAGNGGVYTEDNVNFFWNDANDRLGIGTNLPRTGLEVYTDQIITSSNVWTARTSANDYSWTSVTYGNGLFVAVSSSGVGNRVMTSPDGINWTARTTPVDNNWSSVTYGNGLFVAVSISGTGNRVMTSPDGINWTARTTPADNNWRSVTYGNGLFVAVSENGTNRIMTSPDGITWTVRSHPVGNVFVSVTYGNGLFVAIADSGTSDRVITSPDGITWTARSVPVSNAWASVTYGNGLFVAVSYTGTNDRVITSPNGINWTVRTSAANLQWNCITYGDGMFVAVSESAILGGIMTSPDGINWVIRNKPNTNSLTAITYSNNIFVVVSNSGTGNRVITSGKKSFNEIGFNNQNNGVQSFTQSVIVGSNATPQRTLHVSGEVRITDLITDAPTVIVGADADGDLNSITIGSGLTLSNGVLSGGSSSLTLNNNNIFVGNASNIATGVTMSGDATIVNTGVLTISNNAITNAKLRQSTSYSVIGNSSNITSNVGDITATSDHQVLRRSGTTLGFGAINLAQSAAVTGTLGVTNGGTGTSTGFTTGSVVFAGTSSIYSQDNTNLFWNNTNKALGIGTNTPQRALHVNGEIRVSDLITDTPTRLVGADADGDLAQMTLGGGMSVNSGTLQPEDCIIIACSDEITNLITTNNPVVTFRLPYAGTITGARISVNTAPTGSSIIVDVNKNGSSIFTTNPQITAGNKVNNLAQAVLNSSQTAVTLFDEITVDIDAIGSTIAGKGLKLYLYIRRS